MALDTKAPGPDDPIGPVGDYSAERVREVLDLVKSGSALWASDLAKRAAAKGVEWTPQEAQRAAGILSKQGVQILDDINDQSLFAARTEGVGVEKPLIERVADKAVSAASLGMVVPSGQYEGEGTLAGGVADVAGGLIGMSMPVGAATQALRPLGAMAGPAAFGLYGGVTAGEGLDLAERGKSAAFNTALGAGLHVAPPAAVALVEKIGGKAAADRFAAMLGSVPGRAATAGATMAGLEAVSGGDPLAGGIGGVLAAAATGGLVPAMKPRPAEVVRERPLAGLAEAEARIAGRPIEPQDAPVMLDAPVVPRGTPQPSEQQRLAIIDPQITVTPTNVLPAPAAGEQFRDGYRRMVDKEIHRSFMDELGRASAAELEESGITPKPIVAEFWNETYGKMDSAAKAVIHKYLKRLTGFEPGSVIGSKNGVDVRAVDWREVYPASETASKWEYLDQSGESGLIVLMEQANRHYRTNGRGVDRAIIATPPSRGVDFAKSGMIAIEPPKPASDGLTFDQRVELIKSRSRQYAERKARDAGLAEEDAAAREAAFASGALTSEQARAQRMAESAARRQQRQVDASSVIPAERTTRGYTDAQLYEATRTPEAMKRALGAGLSFPEIMEGKARAKAQMERINGSGNADVRLGIGAGGISRSDLMALYTRTKGLYDGMIAKATGGQMQFDEPRAVNQLDAAGLEFLRTGDITEYAKRLTGKIGPSEMFRQEIAGLEDVGLTGEHYLSGRSRSLQKAGGGKLGSAIERDLLWTMRTIDDATVMWTHQQKARVSDWIDKYGARRGTRAARRASMRAQDDARSNDPDMIELRDIYESIRDQVNVVRAATGRSPIGYIKNYVNWIRHITPLDKLLGKTQTKHNEMPDYLNATVNPRALRRTGSSFEKEQDIVVLLNNYIEASARDIFHAPMIRHLNAHASALREAGLTGIARGVEYQTGILYSGKRPYIGRALSAATGESPALGVARKGVLGVKSRLNKAIFPLNIKFMLLTQPLSTALTVKNAGVIPSVKAMALAKNPSFRAWADQHNYSIRTKGNQYGSLRRQDVGGAEAMLSTDLMARTKIGGKAEQFSEYMVTAMERELSMHAAAAHWIVGTRKGLTGRNLVEFVSDGVAKTQSMYNFADLPGLLQERDLTAVALPFQTYAFELMNNIREMHIPVLRAAIGKTGHYANVQAKSPEGAKLLDGRMKQIARWSAFVVAQQMVQNAVNDNEDVFSLSSSIPFYSFIYDYGHGGLILPKQAVKDFHDAVSKFVEYEDWKPLRKFALRYIVRGGIQANRIITGAEAVAAGGEYDIAGKKKFDVREDEAIPAMILGPYSTEGGRAYIKSLEDDRTESVWEPKSTRSGRGRTRQSGRPGR